MQLRVPLFVEMIKRDLGYTDIKVFLDSGYSSQETIDKFKERRDISITNRELLVPTMMGLYLTEAFRKAGVEVLHTH